MTDSTISMVQCPKKQRPKSRLAVKLAALPPWKRRTVLAGAALCLVCFLGIGSLWAWAHFSERPALLDNVPFSRFLLDSSGTPLRLSLAEDDIYRLRCPLNELHPDLVSATLLYEDRWFYQHPGINPLALVRAFASTYLGGSRRMGGSTLTMQVARLRYKLRTSTWGGKAEQMLMALRLEAHYTKEDILEAYFNLAPYGNNVEGAEAAARIYFKTPALRLSRAECIALAVTPQNPGKRNPLGNNGTNTSLMQARTRLARAWAEASPKRGNRSRAHPQALLTAPLQVYGPAGLPFEAPHVSAALLQKKNLSSPQKTTLELPLQHELERVIHDFVAQHADFGVSNASALLLHWPDMNIHALVGSANFHDPAIQGQVDASKARRSPGSTLKPFIYALALDQGLIHPMTVLADSPRSFNDYEPANSDHQFQGPVNATAALAMSRNIPAISLASQLQYPSLYTFLRNAHVSFDFSEQHYGLSLVLGGAEVSMMELAGLYAMLPNQGLWRAPKLMPDEAPPPTRLLSTEAAFITLNMLRHPEEVVSRTRNLGDKLPMYIKTGTSNGYRDAWCVGVFGPYVLVVWVGNFDNSSNPLFIGQLVGVPLFSRAAIAIANTKRLHDLSATPPSQANLVQIPVCTDTGDTDTSLCPQKTSLTWFIPGVSPIVPSGVLQRILVDTQTGLRACRESGTTKEVVWEFWSSDMVHIFSQAGVSKPPPPQWMPGCQELMGIGEAVGTTADHAGMRITVPKRGVTYQLSLSRPEQNAIPLSAVVPHDTKTLFWFAGNRLIGQTAPDKPLLWTPPPGSTNLRVLDDKSRSARVYVTTEMVE